MLTFVKRDDYWNADAYPYRKIVVTVMPDVTARLNALKTEQVDGAILNAETAAEAEASGLAVHDYTDATNGIVIFDRAGAKVPALGDVRVRQGDEHGVRPGRDREGAVPGPCRADAQMFGSDTDAYLRNSTTYGTTWRPRSKLMAQAGYEKGFTIEIPSRSPQTEQANPLIVQQLALLDITVTEVPLPSATAVQGTAERAVRDDLHQHAALVGPVERRSVDQPERDLERPAQRGPRADRSHERRPDSTGRRAHRDAEEDQRYVVENAWFVPWNMRVAYFATAGSVELVSTGDIYTKIPQLRDFQ